MYFMISDDLTTEVKQILNNLRITQCSVSTKLVIAVGNCTVIQMPRKNVKNGGTINQSIKWRNNKSVNKMGSKPLNICELGKSLGRKQFPRWKSITISFSTLIRQRYDLLLQQNQPTRR